MLDDIKRKLEETKEKISDQLAAPEEIESWCSWCGEKAVHRLKDENVIGRSIYQCTACDYSTVPCRYCENMAKGASDVAQESEEDGKLNRFFKENWNNELCAEHDGTMPDFSKANNTIRELGEFRLLMKPKQKNLYAMAKKTAVIGSGVAAVGTGAILAGPGVAAAAGSAGLLGAAGTGTAISSLSGAALASASVAKLGVGGMAIISAAGAALGGKTGYGIASAYMKDIPDYDFHFRRAPRDDSNHRIVVVNGFLTEGQVDAEDWCEGLQNHEPDSAIWYLSWESQNLKKLGSLVGRSAASFLANQGVTTGIAFAAKEVAKNVAAGGWALGAAQIAGNPWHSAMYNAEKAGCLLAEAISRTEGRRFTLMGHSLGARVIYFALLALATKEKQTYVDDVVLMGGAVGISDQGELDSISQAVGGKIYNCYSDKDDVLRYLYRGANLNMSKPIGLSGCTGECKLPDNIQDIDFTQDIEGHNKWKGQLPMVLDTLGLANE